MQTPLGAHIEPAADYLQVRSLRPVEVRSVRPKQLGQFTKALSRGAAIDRLVKATGLTRQTIAIQLKAMREVGAVHIKRWDRDATGSRSRAVWALGDKEDAARPRMTPAQRQKAYRVRQATKVEAAQ